MDSRFEYCTGSKRNALKQETLGIREDRTIVGFTGWILSALGVRAGPAAVAH